MKLNWGHYIAIAMFSFMIFISYFVYNTFTKPSHDHHLVSEQYYMDELNYQQEIDAVDNAKKLTKDVKLSKTNKGLLISFPKDINNITGNIEIKRPSDVKLDIKIPIELINNTMLIPDSKLVLGMYRVRIKWNANNTKYMYKSKFNY